MGAVRSTPENHIDRLFAHRDNHYFVTVSVCGWQYLMEDFVISMSETKQHVYVIVDGHNGPEIAEFCHRHLL
jgi:serine/threonine protein phosphatase PrpC